MMSATSRFNFTKTNLIALPNAAPGRRDTHFDTRTRGLMLLVTAAGRKAFYVRRKIDGRSERIYIGRFPDDWSVERGWIHRKQHDERVPLQGMHQRSFGDFQADGNRPTETAV
jgi:hypothetical protein